MKPQGIMLDLADSVMNIPTCNNLTAPLNVHVRGNMRTQVLIRAVKQVLVEPFAYAAIPVEVKTDALPADRDLIFKPTQSAFQWGPRGGLYTHMVNDKVTSVWTYIASAQAVRVGRHVKLGYIMNYDGCGVHYAEPQAHSMARALWKDPIQPRQLQDPGFTIRNTSEDGLT